MRRSQMPLARIVQLQHQGQDNKSFLTFLFWVFVSLVSVTGYGSFWRDSQVKRFISRSCSTVNYCIDVENQRTAVQTTPTCNKKKYIYDALRITASIRKQQFKDNRVILLMCFSATLQLPPAVFFFVSVCVCLCRSVSLRWMAVKSCWAQR